MTHNELHQRIAGFGIIPVIAIEDHKAALPLADALIHGGLPVVEITFRTAAAAKVINTLVRERPQLLVGAGTVLAQENLRAALAAGAQFCVAPGLNPDVVERAHEVGMPFVPGVATPTEIERALALGCTVLKFFPAEILGGVRMLDALYAPYRHTGVKFVPTGGVNFANLESYLCCQAVTAVGGTWIAKKEDIVTGAWNDVCQRCLDACAVFSKVRGRAQS